MSEQFFEDPILNSSHERPSRHWQLGKEAIPTRKSVEYRRGSRLITTIPKPRKRGGNGELAQQRALELDALGLSAYDQQYEVTQQINSIRALVEEWRQALESKWKVTAETARQLKNWLHHELEGIRPFFCQIEAVESLIWLMEVAPESGKRGQAILQALENAIDEVNSEQLLIAFNLATGACKSIVLRLRYRFRIETLPFEPSSLVELSGDVSIKITGCSADQSAMARARGQP